MSDVTQLRAKANAPFFQRTFQPVGTGQRGEWICIPSHTRQTSVKASSNMQNLAAALNRLHEKVPFENSSSPPLTAFPGRQMKLKYRIYMKEQIII